MATILTGCGAATPSIDADTAAALQSGVLAVSVAAAAGDFATAQSELTAVRGTLEASADKLTAARTTQIQTAIDLVDADLAAAIAASAPAEPAPTETSTPVNTEDSDESDNSDDSEDSPDPADQGPATDKPAKSDNKGPDKVKDNPGQCKKSGTCD